eukprot:234518_1
MIIIQNQINQFSNDQLSIRKNHGNDNKNSKNKSEFQCHLIIWKLHLVWIDPHLIHQPPSQGYNLASKTNRNENNGGHGRGMSHLSSLIAPNMNANPDECINGWYEYNNTLCKMLFRCKMLNG